MAEIDSKNIEYSFTGTDTSFQAAAKRVSSAFDSISAKALKMQNRLNGTNSSSTRVATSLNKTSQSAKNMANGFAKATGRTTLLGRALRSIMGLSLAKLFASAVTNSIEFIETLNLFQVALDGASKGAMRFINTMSELLGLDPAALMRSMGTFQNLAAAMGFSSDQAYMLSTNFVKLGNDLASLWNTSVEKAWGALESAMVGLSKPIRQYGIDVTIASLQQTALTLGIDDSVDSMTRASKVALTYITIMRRASSSMGDFARTIESPANQLRILQQQFKQLSRAFGDFFLGTISTILPYLNGIVMALTAILRTFATLMGIKVGDFAGAIGGAAGGVEDLGGAVDSTAKKMKKLIAPFDELNVLSEDMSGAADGGDISLGGIDPRIADAMKEYDNLMGSVQMKATKIRDRLMEILGFTKHINDETGEITWTWNFSDMLKGLKSAWDQTLTWWQGLSPGGKLAAILIAGFIGSTVWSGISKLIGFIFNPMLTIIGKVTSAVGNLGGTLSKVDFVGAFAKGKTAVAGFGSKVAGVSLTSVVSIGAIVAAIALVVFAFIDLWNNSKEFRDNFTKAVEDLKASWDTLYTESIKPVIDQILIMFNALKIGIKAVWDFLAPIVKSWWDNFKTWVGDSATLVVKIIRNIVDAISGFLSGDFPKFARGIANVFINLFNLTLASINSFVNFAIDGINWIIRQVNKIPTVDIQTIGHVKWQIPELAEGGMVGAGQLFVANEKGPELVGSAGGGKSAVMNNNQIVDSVSSGVYRAVLDAMGQVQGTKEVPVQIFLGNEMVYSSYETTKRSRGVRISSNPRLGLT